VSDVIEEILEYLRRQEEPPLSKWDKRAEEAADRFRKGVEVKEEQ